MPMTIIEDTTEYQVIEETSGSNPAAQGYWRSVRKIWKPGFEPVEDVIRQRAASALAANIAYLAIATPTNVQVAAQVRLLTREVTALARLVLGQLDSTDGT